MSHSEDESAAPTDATTDAEYNLPVVVGGLVGGVFFGGVGAGVAFPTLPTLGGLFGFTPLVVGLILSANRFVRLFMSTPAGQIIDTVGARKPMIVGLFVQGLVPFGYVVGLTPERVPVVGAAEIFLAARVLWGIGSAFVFVGAFSTIIHVTREENRGRWLGYFRGGQSMGFPSGLVLGGILTDVYGYSVAFTAAGAMGMVAAVVASLAIPRVQPTTAEPGRLRDLPRMVRRDPRILLIGAVNTGVRFLFAGILLSTIVLYAEAHGITFGSFSAVGMSGVLLAITVLASGATTVVAGHLADRVPNRALVVAPAVGALVLGFASLAAFPTLSVTILGVVLIGIGTGGTTPPMLAYLGDISPADDVGKMGGVYNVFGDVGSAIGPVVALPIAARIGYRAEYVLCAGVAVAVLVFAVRPLLDDPTRKRQPAAGDD